MQLIIIHEISHKNDKKKDNTKGSKGGLQMDFLVFQVKQPPEH